MKRTLMRITGASLLFALIPFGFWLDSQWIAWVIAEEPVEDSNEMFFLTAHGIEKWTILDANKTPDDIIIDIKKSRLHTPQPVEDANDTLVKDLEKQLHQQQQQLLYMVDESQKLSVSECPHQYFLVCGVNGCGCSTCLQCGKTL